MSQRLIKHLDHYSKVLPLKSKNFDSEDWIVKTNVVHGIKAFQCYYRQK